MPKSNRKRDPSSDVEVVSGPPTRALIPPVSCQNNMLYMIGPMFKSMWSHQVQI